MGYKRVRVAYEKSEERYNYQRHAILTLIFRQHKSIGQAPSIYRTRQSLPRISVRMFLRFAILIRSAPAEKVSLPWTRIEWPVAKRATRGCK